MGAVPPQGAIFAAPATQAAGWGATVALGISRVTVGFLKRSEKRAYGLIVSAFQ